MAVTIRRIAGGELTALSRPLQEYAFQESPRPADAPSGYPPAALAADRQRVHVLFDDDEPRATAAVWRMRQNVRGMLLPMGGVASVATHPAGRRRGHARRLLTEVLADMREQGQVVSALYPFRASFYQRFGYVGVPQQPEVRLDPRSLAPLLRLDLPGEVTLHRPAEVADEVQRFLTELAGTVPGMAVRDDTDGALLSTTASLWFAVARIDGRVVGYLAYQIDDYGGTLAARRFLYRDPTARTLLLGWVARHADQVSTAALPLLAGEAPETWAIDMDATTRAYTAPMRAPAPMVRVLSVPGLAGLPVGTGEVPVRVDDELIGGVYTLTGDGGLTVTEGGTPAAELTGPGLAALVYGVLDPAELPLRGLGTAPEPAAAALRRLFPRSPVTLVDHF